MDLKQKPNGKTKDIWWYLDCDDSFIPPWILLIPLMHCLVASVSIPMLHAALQLFSVPGGEKHV